MTNRPLQAVPGAAHATAAGCPFALRGLDLHLHSTFSDGLLTPQELCALAAREGVSHVALCDHDTAGGLPSMRQAAREQGLTLIPGVEISTGAGGRMHVLCYGAQVESPEMKAFLASMAQERVERAERMLDNLAQEGVTVPPPRREALLAMPSVGRAHIARELLAMGVVHTMQQAFDRYLLEGRPAYVPRRQLPTAQAVERLRRMRVLPVLAHPMRAGLEPSALHALVQSLCECGLMGLEVYHPSASVRAARELYGLARQQSLLVTGGSDFHGDPGGTARIGRLPSGWISRENDLAALQSALSNL